MRRTLSTPNPCLSQAPGTAPSPSLAALQYRVIHQLGDPGWVDHHPPSCPVVQPILPKYQLPKQNRAESESAKIKVKPTKVRGVMGNPVYSFLQYGNGNVQLTFSCYSKLWLTTPQLNWNSVLTSIYSISIHPSWDVGSTLPFPACK